MWTLKSCYTLQKTNVSNGNESIANISESEYMDKKVQDSFLYFLRKAENKVFHEIMKNYLQVDKYLKITSTLQTLLCTYRQIHPHSKV